VTDSRFVHEYVALKETFGDRLLTVRIVRRDAKSKSTNFADDHSSETESNAIPVDIEIENGASGTMTVEDFCFKCKKEILSRLRKRS